MKRNSFQLFILSLLIPFLFSGCGGFAGGLLLAGGAAGAGTAGTFFYMNGELKTDYNAPFDNVWAACEKTVASMNGTEVLPEKEIARGTINATINDEKVKFYVTYKSKNVTTVAIRVGVVGNRLSAKLLHDRIAGYLLKE
jgi:hypothetical protein